MYPLFHVENCTPFYQYAICAIIRYIWKYLKIIHNFHFHCRRAFHVMSYFMFYFNVFIGVVSCLLRISLGGLLGVIMLPRLQKSTLPRSYERRDPGKQRNIYFQIYGRTDLVKTRFEKGNFLTFLHIEMNSLSIHKWGAFIRTKQVLWSGPLSLLVQNGDYLVRKLFLRFIYILLEMVPPYLCTNFWQHSTFSYAQM